MDENRERCIFARRRKEQVDGLARRIAIRKAQLGAADLKGLGTVKLGIARPPGENLLMLRDRARLLYSTS